MPKRVITYIVPLVLVVLLALCGMYIKTLRTDVQRLRGNQKSLLSEIRVFKDRHNNDVSQIGVLEFKASELKELNDNLLSTVHNLQLKVKRLEALTETVTRTTDTVYIPVLPPIIKEDSIGGIVEQPFVYHDPFTDIAGKITWEAVEADRVASVSLTYSIVDTLDVVIYRVPKRFLFIPYGVKRLDCFLSSRNPHSTVVAGTCVLRKRKK